MDVIVTVKCGNQEAVIVTEASNLDEYDDIVSDLTQYLLDH